MHYTEQSITSDLTVDEMTPIWKLMVQCPWRIDSTDCVLADWRSVSDIDQQWNKRYAALIDSVIESVKLNPIGFDLEIRYSGGYVLTVLCDSDGRTGDCWFLLFPNDTSLAATRDFRLTIEKET